METIGIIPGPDPDSDAGSVQVQVTDEWGIEIVAADRETGSVATVELAIDPGPDSAVELARLLLEAEARVGALVSELRQMNAETELAKFRGGRGR